MSASSDADIGGATVVWGTMNVKAAGAVVLAMLMGACTGGAADPTRSKHECPALGAFPGAMQGGDPPVPEHGNGGYDVQRYTADLRIDPRSARLTLSSSIEAIATQDLTSFSFDHPGSAEPTVLVDDRRAAACQREGKLIIVPGTPITDGATFVTTIETDGIPERGTADAGPGWVQTAASTIVAVGLRGETASWFPMNVTPRDKAAYTMRLSVPAGFAAIGTGRLVSVSEGNPTTYEWSSEDPLQEAGPQLVVGELERIPLRATGRVTSSAYLPRTTSIVTLEDLGVVPEMVAFFEDRFGRFPFERLDVVVVPFDSPDGGTFPGAIVWQASRDLDHVRLAHLMAYQWFQFSVTPVSAGDVWLRTGAVNLAEYLWIEHTDGPAAMRERVRRDLSYLGDRTQPPALIEDPQDLEDFRALFVRGSLALHALRLEVGDERFFSVLQQFTQRYRFDIATTEDFIQLSEEIAGRDLSGFFRRWLLEREIPPLG